MDEVAWTKQDIGGGVTYLRMVSADTGELLSYHFVNASDDYSSLMKYFYDQWANHYKDWLRSTTAQEQGSENE